MNDNNQNNRETGARKLVERPDVKTPKRTETGDRGDRPKRPYGLTESTEDRGSATRHHDGVNQQPTKKS